LKIEEYIKELMELEASMEDVSKNVGITQAITEERMKEPNVQFSNVSLAALNCVLLKATILNANAIRKLCVYTAKMLTTEQDVKFKEKV
jgi:hypothetical protein